MGDSMNTRAENVFRAYDVRGVADRDFDGPWVERLGLALGRWFRERGLDRVVVGRDGRISSPEYAERLSQGLARTGRDVICIGQVSTPVLYHAVHRLGTRAGVMVTASHNPPEYNGFKIWGGDCVLSPEEIQEVGRLMQALDQSVAPEGHCPETVPCGMVSRYDAISPWLEELAGLERIDPPEARERPLRVVVDGGNAPAGELAARLLERAGSASGLQVERLFCEVDPNFPNHHPDPVVEANMEQIQERVVATGADLGLGLDGDGDRLGVVDETGRLWPGDQLLALLARDLLARRPGARIIADVKCSHLLFADIEAHGGKAVMGVTGHSIMKRALREQNAALAGEMSGHLFFADGFFGWDDAAYAALRLMALLSRAGRPLSALLRGWPHSVSTPEIRTACPEEIKFDVVRRVQKDLQNQHRIIDVDGVRVVFPDGWGLVRASNTQPELTMRFEADTRSRLEEIRAVVCDAVERAVRALQ